jgi:hypothetical protein
MQRRLFAGVVDDDIVSDLELPDEVSSVLMGGPGVEEAGIFVSLLDGFELPPLLPVSHGTAHRISEPLLGVVLEISLMS